MTGDVDDALLTRYLVGSCSDDEAARVDEQLFSNEEMYARLRDVEEQLIERRLRGELPPDMQDRFDRAYAAPPRRDRVLYARALQQALPDLKPAPTVWGRASALPSALARPSVFRLPLRLGFAAAALLFIAAVVVSRQQVNELNSSLATAERDNQALRQQRDADRQRMAELEKRTAELSDELRRQRADPATPPRERGLIATFVLMPGRLRSSRTPAHVSIAPGVDRVRLQLALEAGIDYERFTAELRDDESRVLWTERGLRSGNTTGGEAVVVTFPASLVKAGQYEVVLLGADEGGSPEDAGRYYFDVRMER